MADKQRPKVPPSQEVLREILRRQYGIEAPESAILKMLPEPGDLTVSDIKGVLESLGFPREQIEGMTKDIEIAMETVDIATEKLSPAGMVVFQALFINTPHMPNSDMVELMAMICATVARRVGVDSLDHMICHIRDVIRRPMPDRYRRPDGKR
jgi:hypothetical protein